MNMDDLVVAIPKSIENMQLPSPDLVAYYRDVEERVFYIDYQIDDNLLELSKEIIRFNRLDKDIPVEERKPIKIFIDTPGGDVSAMWSFIRAMEISKTPCYTINLCCAYSAGADILAAGHKRFAMPGTSVLIHSGSCYYGGEQSVVESMKKYFDALDKKVDEFLFSHTSIDQKVYKRKASSDLYMDENECLKNSVIDSIISDFEEIM